MEVSVLEIELERCPEPTGPVYTGRECHRRSDTHTRGSSSRSCTTSMFGKYSSVSRVLGRRMNRDAYLRSLVDLLVQPI